MDADFVEQSVKDFIENRKDKSKPVVIVWDNGPIHHAKSLKSNFDQWEQQDVYIFYLPKYSPHLNPIEIFWRRVKYKWLSKVDYKSWAILKKAILAVFKKFGSLLTINFNQLVQNNIPFNSA